MDVLKDKVALVVGADEIGSAIAASLAAKGAKVVAADSDEAKVKKGANIEAKKVDPTSAADVKRLVDDVTKQFGRIDILVNNVSALVAKPIGEVSDADWQKEVSTNLNSAFYLCREVIPKMRAQKYGRVVNISSIEYLGWPGVSSFSATESALFGFTRSLALESARDAVTVNTVVKGDIATAETSQETAEKVGKSLPVGRIGTPEDVANAVGFFVTEAAKYATGQTLFVCGGKSAHFSMAI
jgi:NAD(P)-dependent dehydrogenase (short-subunit alcohol dehydrogenase family)